MHRVGQKSEPDFFTLMVLIRQYGSKTVVLLVFFIHSQTSVCSVCKLIVFALIMLSSTTVSKMTPV